MNTRFKGHALMVGCAISVLAFASPSFAQQANQKEQSASNDETVVIVTARRSEEKLQNVPIAITAISANKLRETDTRTAYDLQRLTPSLNVSGSLGRNSESFTLRGQRSTGEFNGAGAGAAVVPYFADTPDTGGGPGKFFDLASVQVLKGPQGTLFGRNTTGGAILFEPQKPKNELGGYASLTYGNYNRVDVEGVFNAPIIPDKLLLRIGAQAQTREGFTIDQRTGKDYDNRDNWSARASILFSPVDNFENLTILRASEYNENGVGTVLVAVNPLSPFAPYLQPYLNQQKQWGIRKTALSALSGENGKTDGVINKTTWKISDNVKLDNIVSYTQVRTNSARDEDGTILAILDSNGADPGGWNDNYKLFTEELRFSGKLAGMLDWQFGGYYDNHKTQRPVTYSQVLSMGAITHQTDAKGDSKSKAAFGQATLDVGAISPALKGLHLSAGVRKTWDEGQMGALVLVYPAAIAPGTSPRPPAPVNGYPCQIGIGGTYPTCFFEAGFKGDGMSYMAGADYQMNDNTLLYASYRRGYKTGGFNPIVAAVGFSDDTPGYKFKPETVDAYEIGTKLDWNVDGVKGRTNIAVYESKYNDIQVLTNIVVANIFATTATQNAAKGTIQGIEIEGDIRPTSNFTLGYGYSHTDAKYDDFMFTNSSNVTVDLSGLPFLYTPKDQFNVSGRLNLGVPSQYGNVFASVNYSWQSKSYVGGTDPNTPNAYIDSYGLVGARLDWNSFMGSNVDISIFGTNLTNEEYQLATRPLYNTNGFVSAFYGEPRMYGASIRASF